ncbi:MAG TPA: cyclic nucleotide-binding domain-containing protein [Anaerolineales bacterium]|nr:cyclic nucleotide-binding domain-containing protein [Anaerolineales bacterium]
MSDLTNFLKQADIFYQVTPAQLEMIANICQERTFAAGEIIVEEGAGSKELYIITGGEVEILVNPALVGKVETSEGMTPIATLRPGQSFGEVALVDEGQRSATVRAVHKNTRLLVLSRDKVIMLCETYPQLGYRLMFNLAADLAMKMRNTDLRIRETLLYGKRRGARE